MKKESIIIIGGGAAGLMAAYSLADQYQVVLLEASSRLGGRIHTQQLQQIHIETGAEFIHGHQPITLQLMEKAGIACVPVEGKMYGKEKGEWSEQTEMIEGWDELLHQMKKVKEDMTMKDFLHNYFGGDKYADLRRHAMAYTEGFDLAPVEEASVRSLYKEWSHEEAENFRIPAGYSALIHYLKEQCEKKGCSLLTNHTVKQVDWERGDVTVYTHKEKFSSQRLIVAVPLGILRSAGSPAAINFTPPLDEYVKAAGQIGMGTIIKACLLFREAFWKKDMGFVFSNEIFPTWWTQLPVTTPLLTGWCGGTRAKQLSDLPEEELLEKAILSLAVIFDKSPAEIRNLLLDSRIINWQQELTTPGGYSYNTLESEAAKKVLNTPVADTIFFAGEGLYGGSSPGTVEAALESGKEVAGKVL